MINKRVGLFIMISVCLDYLFVGPLKEVYDRNVQCVGLLPRHISNHSIMICLHEIFSDETVFDELFEKIWLAWEDERGEKLLASEIEDREPELFIIYGRRINIQLHVREKDCKFKRRIIQTMLEKKLSSMFVDWSNSTKNSRYVPRYNKKITNYFIF